MKNFKSLGNYRDYFCGLEVGKDVVSGSLCCITSQPPDSWLNNCYSLLFLTILRAGKVGLPLVPPVLTCVVALSQWAGYAHWTTSLSLHGLSSHGLLLYCMVITWYQMNESEICKVSWGWHSESQNINSVCVVGLSKPQGWLKFERWGNRLHLLIGGMVKFTRGHAKMVRFP